MNTTSFVVWAYCFFGAIFLMEYVAAWLKYRALRKQLLTAVFRQKRIQDHEQNQK